MPNLHGVELFRKLHSKESSLMAENQAGRYAFHTFVMEFVEQTRRKSKQKWVRNILICLMWLFNTRQKRKSVSTRVVRLWNYSTLNLCLKICKRFTPEDLSESWKASSTPVEGNKMWQRNIYCSNGVLWRPCCWSQGWRYWPLPHSVVQANWQKTLFAHY